MRDYGKVYTAFWTSEDIRELSEDARTLALYLLTCPHGNMLGCFRLTNAYAADDLKWEVERVSKGFEELFRKGFAYRCERTFWVFIRQYLKWNQFDNPNVGKAAAKLFDTISAPTPVKALLVKALREFSTLFPAAKLAEFEAKAEPFQNPFETLSKTVVVAVVGTGTVVGAKSDVEQTPLDPPVSELVVPTEPDPIVTIFAYWQKVMNSPKSVLDSKRKQIIRTALKAYSPADICKAIRGCAKSPFNMGENDRKTRYNGLNLILRDAEHIDHFIALDNANAKPAKESLEDMNARIAAEFLSDGQPTDDNVIDMEPA
ncbi:hypothetical protein [Noviherbaspirillum malthae]|uniref:hypothetical protein n=1 Tax=Noviherbaspirillum malthae TaxID=1260987 RepID=UPI00188E7608|nr:hypothetical protein [Noviherbaspirillum malthae]